MGQTHALNLAYAVLRIAQPGKACENEADPLNRARGDVSLWS